MKTHILKTIGTVWDAVAEGRKTFEVRRNDRFFQSGDVVRLRRIPDHHVISSFWTEEHRAGYDFDFEIGWILQGGQFGIEPGYCVFQLETLGAAKAREGSPS